jgi:uncharacterized protein DUF1707
MPLQRPYPHLRASDADRERVAVFLRDQAAVGRLTHDELEERVGAAYRAVTLGDLDKLIADLPRAHPPVPGRRREHHPARALIPLGFVTLLAIAAPTALFVAAAVVAALGFAAIAIVFAVGFTLGPFILVALLIVALLRRRRPPRRMRWNPHPY